MRSILVVATFIAVGWTALEAGAEPVIEGNSIEGVRNARYSGRPRRVAWKDHLQHAQQ